VLFIGFKNGFSTFMDTARESRLWHNGIYKGLKAGFKTHNPDKVYERMKISEYGMKEWYGKDGHYFDVPFIFMYLVSTAVELGLLAVAASYLGV
jgi:hypothetical protein